MSRHRSPLPGACFYSNIVFYETPTGSPRVVPSCPRLRLRCSALEGVMLFFKWRNHKIWNLFKFTSANLVCPVQRLYPRSEDSNNVHSFTRSRSLKLCTKCQRTIIYFHINWLETCFCEVRVENIINSLFNYNYIEWWLSHGRRAALAVWLSPLVVLRNV